MYVRFRIETRRIHIVHTRRSIIAHFSPEIAKSQFHWSSTQIPNNNSLRFPYKCTLDCINMYENAWQIQNTISTQLTYWRKHTAKCCEVVCVGHRSRVHSLLRDGATMIALMLFVWYSQQQLKITQRKYITYFALMCCVHAPSTVQSMIVVFISRVHTNRPVIS